MTDTLEARRLRTILAAIVIALVLAEVSVRLLADQLPPPEGWPTEEYAEKVDQIRALERDGGAGVVAFGSSVMDVSFDPAQLATDAAPRGAYNAGVLGTSPSVINRWAHLGVLDALRPDTVLVGISSRDLNANGVATRGLDQLFLDAPEVQHLLGTESFADRIQRRLEKWSSLVAHRESLRRPLQSTGAWTPEAFVLDLTPRGFDAELADDTYRADAQLQDFYRANLLHDFRLSQAQIKALEQFLTELENEGTRAVVVDVPVTELYVTLHPRGAADVDDYEAAIAGVAERSGAELVSFGRWDSALFADPLHVNGAGATRVTTELGDYLEAQPDNGTGATDL